MFYGVKISGDSSFAGWWLSASLIQKTGNYSITSDRTAALKFWTPWGAWKAKLRYLSKTKRKSEVRFLWSLF